MKVFSLYHHNKFVASFPSREEAISYGKECGGDPWDYDIQEEYLNKTQYQMFTCPYSPYTTLTPSQTVPRKPGLDTGITLMPGTPQINNSVRAE